MNKKGRRKSEFSYFSFISSFLEFQWARDLFYDWLFKEGAILIHFQQRDLFKQDPFSSKAALTCFQNQTSQKVASIYLQNQARSHQLGCINILAKSKVALTCLQVIFQQLSEGPVACSSSERELFRRRIPITPAQSQSVIPAQIQLVKERLQWN